ncbi:hypothetical protein JT358_17025 [Micrococcales bacterium 31B]|nr:hypothetical protein [Micrococcales bacterium 31B]
MNAAGARPNPAPVPILPVLLGGDIGVYALVRAFHEEYGVCSTVISTILAGPVAHSTLIDNVLAKDLEDRDEVLAAVLRVVEANPDKRVMLLANADWFVEVIIDIADRLPDSVMVPFLSRETLDIVADKARFAEVCQKLGLSIPDTVVVKFGGEVPAPFPVPFEFPVVAKAASSTEYNYVDFPGKAKVHVCDTQAELDELLQTINRTGWQGEFVLQDFIPGDDTGIWSLTCYVDRNGRVTMQCSAQVLIQEQVPSALGNPAAMITEPAPDIMQQARAFLAETNYRGFANFDLKFDPRDNSMRFFEVNPRIGRNNYYVTANGLNPARFMVEDRFYEHDLELEIGDQEVLYTVLPLRLVLKYLPTLALQSRVRRLIRAKRVVNPLVNPVDRKPRRVLYVRSAILNQWRKFGKYAPKPGKPV